MTKPNILLEFRGKKYNLRLCTEIIKYVDKLQLWWLLDKFLQDVQHISTWGFEWRDFRVRLFLRKPWE